MHPSISSERPGRLTRPPSVTRLRGIVRLLFVTAIAGAAACGPAEEPDAPAESPTPEDSVLIPATATLERAGELLLDPLGENIHPDPRQAEMIRLGFRISQDPQTYAADFVGNDLTCGNCHLNAGQRARALPLVGVAATFPQYRRRDDRLVSLEDRIGGCFKRSMNGIAPPHDHEVTIALDAYITWLGTGYAIGARPDWLGQNVISEEARVPIDELDLARGRQLYTLHCASCHAPDGQGLDLGVAKPGPLWGERSWNDGAGAARVWRLAGYVRYAMPLTAPGTLTDEEAQQIAAYVNAHDRPEYPDKASDFPGGGRPQDAVYDTLVFPVHPLKAKLAALGGGS